MGEIFCHVIKMKQFNHDNPSIIFGNQKWKGADPIFINRVEFIIMEIIIFISNFIKVIFIKIINKKLIDAIDWIKKYFNEASEENKFFEFEIRGIKLNKLISKPIQHPNHELEEIEIKVLKNKLK